MMLQHHLVSTCPPSCPPGALPLRLPRKCSPRSATTCVLPVAIQHKLQSYLQITATCAELEGVQERPSCESKPAAFSAGFGATYLEIGVP